ncbi:hypothetical protein [Sphingomonas panni]|uniref:hypothetical protein n=1 Tax=Sphingomonas panni TaxID=237612 RepID=UPI001F5C08BE|nr:hypothetical protein [Sphingomonas panni]
MLVIDALGFSQRIRAAGGKGLAELAEHLRRQFHSFQARVPFERVAVGRDDVVASSELATLQLNDMFVLHATRQLEAVKTRFLISASMLFQQMLIDGQIPRGGLGFGPIHRSRDVLIGNGFLDAYEAAEKRSDHARHICAVLVSPAFMAVIPNTKHTHKLLCFYRGRFYIHPWFLADPQLGEFNSNRILTLLADAGANRQKLDATEIFLDELEDYDTAMQPGSASRRLREMLGRPWMPRPE